MAVSAEDISNNAKVDELLKGLGLDSSPLDPSSRVALQGLFSEVEVTAEKVEVEGFAAAAAAGVGVAAASSSSTGPPPPLQQVATNKEVLQRLISDVTDWNTSRSPSTDNSVCFGEEEGNETTDSVGGSTPRHDNKNGNENRKMEKLMLDQMEQQTRMLIYLHQRMDQLTRTVQQQMMGPPPPPYHQQWYQQHQQHQHQQQPYPMQQQQQQQPPFHFQQQQQQQQQEPARNVPGLDPTQRGLPNHHPQPPQGNAPLPEAGAAGDPGAMPHMIILPFFTRIFQGVQTLPQTFRESRVGKLTRLFVALHNRRVRRLDLSVLIKVLFIMAILMSRIRRRAKRRGADSDTSSTGGTSSSGSSSSWHTGLNPHTKMFLAGLFVTIGFLFQNGFMQFLYSFFIKENYVGRVFLEGDDFEVDRVLEEEAAQRVRAAANRNQPPQPRQAAAAQQQQQPVPPGGGGEGPQPDADNNNNNNNEDGQAALDEAPVWNWRHTLLGGGIAPDGGAQRPMILIRIFQDILFLVGSFFLSIFPMWRPMPVPQPQPPAPQPPEAGEADGNNNNINNNNNNEQLPAQQEPLPPANNHEPDQIPQVRPPVDPAEVEDDDE